MIPPSWRASLYARMILPFLFIYGVNLFCFIGYNFGNIDIYNNLSNKISCHMMIEKLPLKAINN